MIPKRAFWFVAGVGAGVAAVLRTQKEIVNPSDRDDPGKLLHAAGTSSTVTNTSNHLRRLSTVSGVKKSTSMALLTSVWSTDVRNAPSTFILFVFHNGHIPSFIITSVDRCCAINIIGSINTNQLSVSNACTFTIMIPFI